MGLGGVQTAEGCSGGAPSEGWNGVRVLQAEDAAAVTTDGFVLLHGAYYASELDPTSPGISVLVTDENDQPVSGQLRVLQTQPRTEWTEVYLGWQADDELEIGSNLKVTWSIAGLDGEGGANNAPASGSVELEVTSAPTPLPTPELSVDDWVEVSHGVGALVDCTASGTSCGPAELQVPTRAVRRLGVETSWQAPAINGMVAWQTWAETSDPANGFTLRSARSLIHRGQELPVSTGVVAFEEDASDFCVVAVVKDLVSGEERRSAPVCDAEQAPSGLVSDHLLSSCDDPPTPDALTLWCEGHRDDPRCAELLPSDGGAGGSPSVGPLPSAGEASDGGAPPRADDDGKPAPPATSSGGCQVTPAPSGFALSILSLAGAVTLARRRRRSAR
jgi:hypothetical protein